MTEPIARDPIYRRRHFERRDDRVMCSLVHHVSAELSGPRRHDGGKWIGRVSHDDSAVGNPVRTGVRKAMEAMGPRARPVVRRTPRYLHEDIVHVNDGLLLRHGMHDRRIAFASNDFRRRVIKQFCTGPQGKSSASHLRARYRYTGQETATIATAYSAACRSTYA